MSLSKLHAIANAHRRITKVRFLRICTDSEINVVVKPGQVCLRGDRYMNFGRHALMDDLLREFLTETNESLDTVDNQLVRFEQDPNNAKILDNIFRLVHTIKGTCGFLGLPRLEALAHAGETLMGKFRDGMPVTSEAVSLILSSIDRIKEILGGLEATEAEPEGTDQDLIVKLQDMVERGMQEMSAAP